MSSCEEYNAIQCQFSVMEELCIPECCVFVEWLHHSAFISADGFQEDISLWFVWAVLFFLSFWGRKENGEWKSTPLPSPPPGRSVLKWGQVTHEPWVYLCLCSEDEPLPVIYLLSLSLAPSFSFPSLCLSLSLSSPRALWTWRGRVTGMKRETQEPKDPLWLTQEQWLPFPLMFNQRNYTSK